MLRNAIAVLAIVLVLGSSGLSTSAFARGPVMVVVTVFAAITLAAASVVLPVTAMAVMATAPAVCVADPGGYGGRDVCGATGAPTMGL